MKSLTGGANGRAAACGRRLLWVVICWQVSGWVAAAEVSTNERGRIVELRTEIAHHDELYFRQAQPEISDTAYDQLKSELEALQSLHPDSVRPDRPVAPLGDDRTGKFPTYQHRQRMLSLDKSYTEAELRSFYERVTKRLSDANLAFVIEPKFDGLAISVTFENGRLVRAVTRGNGGEGDDVTANIRTIASLPASLRRITPDGTENPIPALIELRGEVYMPFAEFARINREREAAGEEPFTHPRNLAASTLKLLNPAEVATRHLAIVFYGWGACEPSTAAPKSQQELHALIRRWALPGVEDYRVVHGADEMWTEVKALGDQRGQMPFPIDGIVVKLDSGPLREVLGATEQAPRWAMAYKFPPSKAETRLRGISFQVGRTGIITPVAELEPVVVLGATISRATLHNSGEIARRDIRIGDSVYVEKSGEVIPNIAGVDLARRPAEAVPFQFPLVCPSCRTGLIQLKGESAVRCPNASCPAQLRRRLEHFASKGCVDIDGLGPAMVDKLVGQSGVKGVADLYRLKREDLLKLGTKIDKTADRLLAGIERSKQAELWRFIYGLGIPRVGVVAAKALANHYGSLQALVSDQDAKGETENHRAVAGVGEATLQSVADFFRQPQNRALVADLATLGIKPREIVSRIPPAVGPPVVTGKDFPALD